MNEIAIEMQYVEFGAETTDHHVIAKPEGNACGAIPRYKSFRLLCMTVNGRRRLPRRFDPRNYHV